MYCSIANFSSVLSTQNNADGLTEFLIFQNQDFTNILQQIYL